MNCTNEHIKQLKRIMSSIERNIANDIKREAFLDARNIRNVIKSIETGNAIYQQGHYGVSMNTKQATAYIFCQQCGELIIEKGKVLPIGETKVYCHDNHETIVIV